MINQENNSESIYAMNKPDDDARSQTSNLTSITIQTAQLPTGLQTDFLLIDLRDPDQYEEYHIKEALSFPGPRIKQDKTLPQLHQYMNKKDKIIIIYHFDEKKGLEYVQHFVEKGYENLYLLNGGIEAFGQEFKEGLEGKTIPVFGKKE
jgi:centrosomal protein CEP41